MLPNDARSAPDTIPWLPQDDRDAAFDRALTTAAFQRCRRAFTGLHALVSASDFLAEVHDAWQRLAWTWDGYPIEVTRRRATSPIFRGWLQALAQIAVTDAWRADNPRIHALARLAANMAWDWSAAPLGEPLRLRADRGVCETWDCRFLLAVEPGTVEVILRREPDGVRVTRPSDESTVPGSFITGSGPDVARSGALTRAAMLPGGAVAVCNNLPSLQVHLAEHALPERDAPMDDSGPGDRYYGAFDLAPYLESAGLLARAWPVAYASWCEQMHVYVPRTVPPGWYVGGFTSSRWQGSAWIVVNNDALFLETLVHEHSHVRLRYIEEVAPILAARDDRRFRVGWRDDPRPIIGLVEGVYVHIHSIEALLRAARIADPAWADRAVTRARKLFAQIAEAAPILRREARFTAVGEGFQGWVESWLDAHPFADGPARR